MEVIIRDQDHEFNNWEGETVGITGQFLVIRLLYDPHGNKCGKRRLVAATPLQLFSPVDWERYR